MQETNPSAVKPIGRRRGRLLAGTLALTIGTLGAGLAATALPASASVTSNTYTIGSPTSGVSAVTVTPSTTTASLSTGYAVKFTATAALSQNGTITITDSLNNVVVGSALLGNNVQLIDTATGCLQPGNAVIAGGALQITLGSGCSIAAGNTVEVDFTVTNPSSGFQFNVVTSANGTSIASNTITVNALPPTLSAASLATGVNTTYSIGGVGQAASAKWSALTSSATTLVLTTVGTGPIAWYSGPAGYTVSYTPSGGSVTADAVNSATVAGTQVTLGLASGIPSNATTTITAVGTNPATPGQSMDVTIAPEYTPAVGPITSAGPTETTNAITFGTSVSAVTVAASPSLASESSTYAVSFKDGTGVSPSGYICMSEPNTVVNGGHSENVLVSDTTSGSHEIEATVPGAVACGAGNSIQIPVAGLSSAIAAGDQVTVTIPNVMNPSAGTYSDFSVSTSQDAVGISATAYAITVSSSAGVTVAVSPSTTGALATYTVSSLHASAAIPAGTVVTITVGNSTPGVSDTTVLPNNAGDYTLTDSTTSSGSGTLGNLTYVSGDHVTLTLPNAINSADVLSLTIQDVINPTTPSATYDISITDPNNDIVGPAVTAPVFPGATATYADASIVNFSGTDYLFAGGHAFGIPTPAVLTAVQAIDKATVLTAAAGATVPTAATAVGSMIVVYNNPTIYVVGTDGQLHGFATPAQFLSDGYDGADVITVPNIAGLVVGATAGTVGAGANALATMANGTLVNSSGTFYVFAGGKAFGIPTPASLAAVQANNTATPLSGTITSAETGATIRSGTIVTIGSAVFVASAGYFFAFKSMAQLQADGYAGTPSIVVPNAGGLTTISSYTGS